ncbi:MAG: YncE family protein [Alphaproteobacteria bacterium]
MAIDARALPAAVAAGLALGLMSAAASGEMAHGALRQAPHAHGGQDRTATPADPVAIDVAFALEPVAGGAIVAGKEARAIVRLTDKASGAPLSGRSVAGWMLLRRNAQVADELSCAAKVKLFNQGRVTARPDVDLNGSRLMILNRDGSIGIADPEIDFTITQLEHVIPLPGVPADWAMSADRQTLFVTLPIFGAIAVIDLDALAVTGLIELGKDTLPTQLAALDDRRAAVFLSGKNSVAVVDAEATQPPRPMVVGRGPVAMAAGAGDVLYVASADGRVSAIDTRISAVTASAAALPPGEPSLAWSTEVGRVYAASSEAGAILALDATSLHSLAEIAAEPGVFTLAAAPDGGHVLALNRRTSRLLLVDTASNRPVAEQPVAQAPVELAFSHDYAYVRGLEGDHFSVIELAELNAGRIAPVNVQSASRPMPGREALSRARMIALYGHGALIGNADEAVAYYYMEGMNIAMGTVKTYGPNVQGLMTLDRGFRETEPGVYETKAVIPYGGDYDVPVVVDVADSATCFTASAQTAPEAREEGSAALLIDADGRSDFVARRRDELVFRIVDKETDHPVAGLHDVRLLAFSAGGTWQARRWAKPLGDGRYASDWVFPRAGRYGVSVEIASRHHGFADQPPIFLNVHRPSEHSVGDEGGKP